MSHKTPLDGFKLHDSHAAPEASRPILDGALKKYGFVPNLLGVLAESPVALRAYTQLNEILESGTLSAEERQVVLLTVSVVNRCHYCVAAHSALAGGAGVPRQVIDAIRNDQIPDDPRLGALNNLAKQLVEDRGWLDSESVDSFLHAGFDRQHLLEVVTALAMKTISNYTNHLAETPLDAAFEETAWRPRDGD